jgi:hypothetical protein
MLNTGIMKIVGGLIPLKERVFGMPPKHKHHPSERTHKSNKHYLAKVWEKNHKKRGPHATNDDCDDPVHELEDEPVKNTDANCHESVHEPLNESVTTKNWLPKNQYNRNKKRKEKEKQPINVAFNNSSLVLTDAMTKVLNCGLKFAVLPLKLDITQVLTDFKRFERTMVWREFWFGKDTGETYKPPLFKHRKKQFPTKNIQSQEDYRTF